MYGICIRLLAAAIGLVGATTAAHADRLNLAAGGEYSVGDYGEPQDTAVWYEFVSARYSTAPWAFKVTVPFLRIDGPATVTDDGEVEAGGVDRMVSGIGDVSLSTTYTFSWKPEKLYLDLIGRVRLPTGDEDRGLGSGEIDYSLLANLDKGFEGFNIYVEAGRRFLGNSVVSPREDGWVAATGISTDLSKETEIGASFAWREAAFEGSPDPAEVSAYVKHYLTPDLRANLYALAGLSNGSPNAGAGITLTWTAYRSD